MSRPRTALIAILALGLAVPVSAQSHRTALTIFGGAGTYSNMAVGGTSVVRLSDGWQAGFQAERWTGRLGYRLNGIVTERGLADDATQIINLYTADLDLMLRLLKPVPGRAIAPYITAGGGAALYNLWGDGVTSLGGETYGPDPAIVPTVQFGAGVDIGGGPVAFRLEIMDVMELQSALIKSDGTPYGAVHHVVGVAGLSFRLGRRALPQMLAEEPVEAPEVVAEVAPEVVEAAPAPAAAPTIIPVPAPVFDSEVLVALTRRIEELTARVEELSVALAERPLAAPVPIAAQVVAPEPEPTPVTAPAPAPSVMHEGTLYTVQIASYLADDVERAERAASELRQQGVPVWIARADVNGRTVNRVRVGALPTEHEARVLAMHINRVYEWPCWVTEVESAEPVPGDAVMATRHYMESTNN